MSRQYIYTIERLTKKHGPREVLKEFGLVIPPDIQVRVHDSTADMRYLVLPMRPEGTGGWSEERLAALVTRDSMIGVSAPKSPGKNA